ncbi:nuclear transport factor 2 family protein [Longispora albida]|uniref:nuclear transport factor 2 family protein n=1 Tax=Longispora albida TaxID=203523 RepID=UPI00036A9944|nr:nuclear transport factor 2 family protein [Longispora albida]
MNANIVEGYLAAWNAPAAEREARIAETFAPEVTYVDPIVDVAGHEALGAVIGAVQGQFAGLVFSQVGTADAHHNLVRFQWGLGPAGGEPVVIGSDVAVLDEAGRIVSVHGFLDKVPA